MKSAPHLVLIGDVGGPKTYHVGDEAMLEANLGALRAHRPDLTATVVSSDPKWSAEHFGVHAIPPIGFPAGLSHDSDRRALFCRLVAGLEKRGDDGVGREAIEAVSASDGVVVSGGGNLSSTWPEHVFERAALSEIAHRLGKPFVMLGQTIGPELSPEIEPIVARMLKLARLVGVRELPSAALALALGADSGRLIYQTDDAVGLAPMPISAAWSAPLRRGSEPWIAVTMDRFATDEEGAAALGALAEQLGALAHLANARLVFIPHVAATDEKADAAVGRELAARLPSDVQMFICDVLEARQARWLTGQAELIVSTRYHPLVFGLSAGAPCVGIVTDEYRRVKLQGALAHAGMESCCISLSHAVAGGLFETAAELWSRRDEVRGKLAGIEETWRIEGRRRWRRVFAALGLSADDQSEFRDAPAAPADLVLGAEPGTLLWRLLRELDGRRRFLASERTKDATRLSDMERYVRSLETERAALRAASSEAELYALSLLDEHGKLREMCAESARYAVSLEAELKKFRAICA